MLKTRITDQYGLRVPFINAGMAFIATAPLVRAVCEAGGMGMLGAAAMPPDMLQTALRDIKAAGPACFGVNFIAVQWHRTDRGMRRGKDAGRRVLLG
jgi:enoyl-[acyl-carrier protein] reductase II